MSFGCLRCSDGEGTDDEILSAAAISEQNHGRVQRRGEVRQAAPARGGDGSGDELPPGRPSLPAFAAALAFITVGAFVVGSAIRKYILAPADYGSSGGSSSSPSSGGAKSARRRSSSSGSGSGSKGGQKAPSVEDLLRLHGDPLPPPPAAGAATAAAAAPAAAPAGAQQQASAAAPAAAVEAAPAAAAEPPNSSSAAAPAVSSSSQGDSTGSPAAAAAAELVAAPTAAAATQPVQGGQAAADWCETTLAPALAKTAADASAAPVAEQPGPPQPPAAAADAAGPAAPAALLAREQLWMLCQATPKGPVALRLLFPVAGCEQYCVALFQVGGLKGVCPAAFPTACAGLPHMSNTPPACQCALC